MRLSASPGMMSVPSNSVTLGRLDSDTETPPTPPHEQESQRHTSEHSGVNTAQVNKYPPNHPLNSYMHPRGKLGPSSHMLRFIAPWKRTVYSNS